MSKNRRRITILVCFIIIIVLVVAGARMSAEKKRKFEALNTQVLGYASTTKDRVNNSVITLPEENNVVGLENGRGVYLSEASNKEGALTIVDEKLKTQFIPGIYNKKDPRQDAIVPMDVSTDSHDGSMYVLLFNDRGDAAIEKSYARLGGNNIIVDNMSILPGVKKDEEYKVDIIYKVGSNTKELVIPVVDGHFKPEETNSNNEEKPDTSTPTKPQTPSTPQSPTTTPPVTTTPSSPVACTMEAKECSDGSFVSRSGPRCEFALCPSPQQSTAAVINQRIYTNGVYITPIDIIEDSRCPAGATCVWAGRLRIKATLERGGQTSDSMLDLGVNSVVFMGKRVTLTRATPDPRPIDAVPYGQYRFEFSVTDKKN